MFLLYYFVGFTTMFMVLEYKLIFKLVTRSAQNIQNQNIKFEDCNYIKEVSSVGEIIHIEYDSNYIKNVSYLNTILGLKTESMGESIFFPQNTSTILNTSQNSVDLSFYLPIVGNYSANLICGPPIEKARIQSQILVKKQFPVKLYTTDFTDLHDYSRIKCHGTNYSNRWCECKNLLYFDDNFFFLSPAIFTFPEPFIVPGPRAPPFDKDVDRLVSEPLVIQFTKRDIPRDLETQTLKTYIYGVYHNYYMLWHTIFDFILPFHMFVTKYNFTESNYERQIFVKSDGVWRFFSLMKCISRQDIRIISQVSKGMLFPDAVIGIHKWEADMNPLRSYDDSIAFQYNYNNESDVLLRSCILENMNIKTDRIGNNGKPLVIMIDRKSTSRNIGNQRDIEALVKRTCEFCDVQTLNLEDISVDEQVEMFSRASVLIGLHGSGLANCMWMMPYTETTPTHMIEFLPYNYSCRPWYETAANVSRVKYHAVMNDRPTSTDYERYGKCWKNHEKICATLGCHDLLRDQKFSVELNIFEKTWLPIVEDLKKTKVNVFEI